MFISLSKVKKIFVDSPHVEEYIEYALFFYFFLLYSFFFLNLIKVKWP